MDHPYAKISMRKSKLHTFRLERPTKVFASYAYICAKLLQLGGKLPFYVNFVSEGG